MSIVRDLRLVSLLRPTPSHCPETGEYEAKMEPVGAIYISIPVSYTHLDVYKRQVYDEERLRDYANAQSLFLFTKLALCSETKG